MAPIIKCLLSYRNTPLCENCKGLRQSRSCTTEFEKFNFRHLGLLTMSLRLRIGRILVLEGVPTIQSVGNMSVVRFLTCKLPNSCLGAFRLRLNPKNTKICKILFATSKGATGFTFQKKIGPSLCCLQLMLHCTSYWNDLLYRLVAKCDWTRF